jgi:hypothetical protein
MGSDIAERRRAVTIEAGRPNRPEGSSAPEILFYCFVILRDFSFIDDANAVGL